MATKKAPTTNYSKDKDFSVRPDKENKDLKKNLASLVPKRTSFNELVVAVLKRFTDEELSKKPEDRTNLFA